MRKYYLGILGAGAFVGGFLITLWLSASGTPPAPATPPDIKSAPLSLNAEVFATHLVPDEGILPAITRATGLQPSPKLKGFIDDVTRLDDAKVKIRGWAADELGEGDPIVILVFAKEKTFFRHRRRELVPTLPLRCSYRAPLRRT